MENSNTKGTQLFELFLQGKHEIHVSDVRAFLSCRRKWEYVSPLKMYLEPLASYPPFIVGRAVHYALETYYDSGKTVSPTQAIMDWYQAELQSKPTQMQQEAEQMADNLELSFAMMKHYHQWVRRFNHAGPWSDDNLEFISMETEFKVPFQNMLGHWSKDWYFAGRFDGIVKNIKTGEHWIWESKTTRSTKELANSLWNDNQANAYMIAAQKMFKVEIAGVLYNVMRKKVPTPPSILKSGLFSVNKQQDLSYDSFMGEVMDRDPRPEDMSMDDYTAAIREAYGPYLDYLLDEENQYKWFARIPVRRTQLQLQIAEDELYTIAEEMVNNPMIYPSPSWINCNWCMFKEPCMRKSKGEDDSVILKNEFQPRREWDPMTGKEEDNAE